MPTLQHHDSSVNKPDTNALTLISHLFKMLPFKTDHVMAVKKTGRLPKSENLCDKTSLSAVGLFSGSYFAIRHQRESFEKMDNC